MFQEALLALAQEGEPLFAVLDGAQFDNLPEELMFGDFVSRSLYLDRGDNDPNQVITAPHMVWLNETGKRKNGRKPDETIPALLTLIGDRPAAVFWQCPAGGDALYKHLRSINMVLYPKSEIEDWAEPEPPEGQEAQTPDTHTLVLFRHADANVMVQVFRSLATDELPRLYGPATRLVFRPEPEWLSGKTLAQFAKQDDLPQPKRGFLRLSAKTLQRLDRLDDEARLLKTRDYLHDVCPEVCEDMTEAELITLVKDARKSGIALGLKTEYGLGLWAFMHLLSDGEAERDKDILAAIQQPGASPDQMVEAIVDQTRRQT